MMSVDFQNHFWGDKQNGFDVLYQNLKYGSTAVKELSELLRSRIFLEEYNNNFLQKLSRKTISTTNNQQLGTFQPIWSMLRTSTEKLSSVHMETIQRLNQLMKEMNKYFDEHHRKQKQIKNEESTTIDIINELKETSNALNKAKEFFHSKQVELERLRKDSNSVSQKDIEKAEARTNKASIEYQNLIEKYTKVKEEFERKFSNSCRKFQTLEENHMNEMKNYLTIYTEILESSHAMMGQVYNEFRQNFTQLSTEKLLELFIQSKATGTNRPATIQFEEANIATNQQNQLTVNSLNSTGNNNTNSKKDSNTNIMNLFTNTSSTITSTTPTSSNSMMSSASDLNLFNNVTASPMNDIKLLNNNGIMMNEFDAINNDNYNSQNNQLIAKDSVQSSSNALLSSSLNSNNNNNNVDHCKKDVNENTDSNSDVKSHPNHYSTINSLESFVLQTIKHQQQQRQHFDHIKSTAVSTTTTNTITTTATTKDHHKSFPDLFNHHNHHLTPKWFLRSRKDKNNKNKSLKDKKETNEFDSCNDNNNNEDITSNKSTSTLSNTNLNDSNTQSNELMIDAEGYTIRPPEPIKKNDSFTSSDSNNSGDDSDDFSDDGKEKKIFVKIKPLSTVTSTADDNQQQQKLMLSAAALTLSAPSSSSNVNRRTRDISSVSNSNSSNAKTNEILSLFDTKCTDTNFPAKTHSDIMIAPIVGTVAETTAVTTAVVDRYAAFSELSNSSNDHSILKTSDMMTQMTTTPSTTTYNVLPLPPKSVDHSKDSTLPIAASSTITTTASFTKSTLPTSAFSTMNTFSVYKPSQAYTTPNSSQHPLVKSQSLSSTNGMMSRTESIMSLSSDFRMTPISLCSSRDSSPLTIGMSDIIPVAIAFQESIGSCFKGVDGDHSKITIIGCIKIAFSAGIIQVLTTNPSLPQFTFRLKHMNCMEKIILSKDLIEQVETNDESNTYEMNMNRLQSTIKRLHEQTPNARYYNLDMIKYQIRTQYGAQNAPLQLVSHWKCNENQTNLKIDYKYNSSAFGIMQSFQQPQPLRNVTFTANIDSNVISMISQPFGKWDSLTKQATWKFPEISQTTDNCGLGSIKAKFDISNGGPSCPSSVYVQFQCFDTLLSGIDFELISSGYRISLIKRQFSTGRYYCEPGTIIKS